MSRAVNIAGKGILPFVLAGLTATAGLERWEGNILKVYPDRLANGLPTYCAGMTDWNAKVGTTLTPQYCTEVNKTTLIKYGLAIAACTEWKYLTQFRFDALTLFAINVGVRAACGSQTVKMINAGKIKQGCDLLAFKPNGTPNWSFAMGKFIAGLYNRRLFERDWCLRGLT